MSTEISEPLIGHALLREAAFELLASSTIARYEREARRLAMESGLVREMQAHHGLRASARARVLELLEALAQQSQRTPAEVEAAILLCALVPTDPEPMRPLLCKAAESSSPWIRALAARLVRPQSESPATAPHDHPSALSLALRPAAPPLRPPSLV